MEISLKVFPRIISGKQTKNLRQQGILPAILYGRGKKNLSLQVPIRDFEIVYRQAGENTLVNLDIEGDGQRKVMIHDVAEHFLGGAPVHVDFYEVDLTRKIHARIPIQFTGSAPAIKELGGTLVRSIGELEIEALPMDLPSYLEASIDSLKTFENLLRVRDVVVGEKIKVLQNPEEVIASVQPPRSEEELAELEKPTAEAEKEAIESMKAEESVEEAEAGADAKKVGEEAKEAPKENTEKS